MNISIEEPAIKGIEIKKLQSHGDDRGFFREIIRNTDDFFANSSELSSNTESNFAQSNFAQSNFAQSNFAQWSHSRMVKHTIKAWHYHHKQTDWWYICGGHARVGLIDNREESKTYGKIVDFIMGDDTEDSQIVCVKIPPGVLHGCRVLSESANLLYITSQIYDPKDEGRIPFNASEINFDWGNEEGVIVAENDKKYFTPAYQRIVS
jgi:dTDP-4-dehydrorhamnose 3,5-epimerase